MKESWMLMTVPASEQLANGDKSGQFGSSLMGDVGRYLCGVNNHELICPFLVMKVAFTPDHLILLAKY
jgi:hypothetical protein